MNKKELYETAKRMHPEKWLRKVKLELLQHGMNSMQETDDWR